MKFVVTIDGREHTVNLPKKNQNQWQVDASDFDTDAIEILPGVYSLIIDGRSFTVHVESELTGTPGVPVRAYICEVDGRQYRATVHDPRTRAHGRGADAMVHGPQSIVALMPGKIVRLLVEAGQKVESGQGLLVMEAMKMQNEIRSPKAGKVEKILVKEAQAVNAGEILLSID